MNENQTLEMQILAKGEEATKALDKLITRLTGVEKTVSDVEKKLNKGSIKNVKSNVDNLTNSTDKATKSIDKLGKSLSLGGAYLSIKRLTGQMLNWMDLTIDRTEQMNLFNVVFKNIEKNGKKTFSTLGKEATKFQYSMHEAFGTNLTETLKYQGLFQSMGENVGIPDNYSAIMSETMTKLTYDLASLYNKSESTTGEALRAGVYAGQTKPLRSYGIDVTQTSMQPVLDSLGITDRSVKQMSQAEKEILRYIATLRQAKVAMGDFANTIESPANQIKVFKQQLVEAKVAISSLFIGTFADILPYANAFLMVIKEVSKAIANMFGIKLSDYNTGIASQEDAYIDLGDSIGDATDAVKELKRQTLGFDQINNINENKDSGSGSGSVSGGIDQRLLDAIKGYDNGMEKVRMKATEIRDRVMEWLGFTKKTNSVTGETYFEYEGIDKTLKNMWKSFKGLSTTGKVLVGLGLVAGATKLWNIGKKLVDVTGSSGLGKAVKNLLSPTKNLLSTMKEYIKYSPSLSAGIKSSLSDWHASVTAIDKFKVGLVGVIGLSMSLEGMSASMKSVAENGLTFGNSLGTVASGLGSVASGAMIGTAIMPGLGTAIGAVGGGVVSLVTALLSYKSASENVMTVTKQYREEMALLSEQAGITVNSNLAQIEHTQRLVSELGTLIDSNGKVKQGYEDRANFILNQLNNAFGTEYELVGNAIYNNGKLVNSYNDIKSSVEDLIVTKKAEIILEAYKEKYIKSLEAQKVLQDEINIAYDTYKDKVEKLNEKLQSGKITQEEYNEKVKDYAEEFKKTYEANNREIGKYQENIKEYDDLLEASASGNIEKISKALENYISTNKNVSNDFYESIIKGAKSCKVEIDKQLDNINKKKMTPQLSVDTSKATKSLNEFGYKINNAGLGKVWAGISLTPAYANGGFPEDGLFFANHSELVGKFSNGKTAVANNAQIVEGIKAGVYEAVAMAMSQYGGQASQVEVHVHTDEGTVVDRINQTTKQTGVCPINIPGY